MGGSTSVAYYSKEETMLVRKTKEKIHKSCKLNLKRVSRNTRASPLLLFCEIISTIDKDVNDAIRDMRGGNDVFVVIIKTCYTHPGTNKHLSDYLQVSTRGRIGDACIFFYNIDLTATNFHEDNKIACHGLKRFMSTMKHTTGRVVQPQVTFQPHPYLSEPVCFFFENRSRMEQETLTFVQSVGQFILQKCRSTDVRSVSPLIVFTPYCAHVDHDTDSVLRQARDGKDVFLIIIETKYGKQTGSNVPNLSDKNKRRLGDCGTLVYSLDTKRFEESSQNMLMIQRLRQFLINTVEANASNSLRRSRTNLDDGRGTLI